MRENCSFSYLKLQFQRTGTGMLIIFLVFGAYLEGGDCTLMVGLGYADVLPLVKTLDGEETSLKNIFELCKS